MKIAVVGTGYVGLVAGTCFADSGHSVTCVDLDENKIQNLKQGQIPIYEPGLEDILKLAIQKKLISFTTDFDHALRENSVIFIAVGTPEGPDGMPVLDPLMSVVQQIAQKATTDKCVVLKSTVPVGTGQQLQDYFDQHAQKKIEVINNPEFLKEGAAVDDFLKPDRVVVGCRSQKAQEIMQELYDPFVKNGHPILFMDNTSAELTKYAANSFLSVKISFINELARLADLVGADINEVRRGFTSDRRINPAFFYPGVGYGGSCFPKDVQALIKTAKLHGTTMDIVEAADRVNDQQRQLLFQKIKNHYQDLNGKTFALWGLSFKPRTDDVREAPALTLIELLHEAGAHVKAYDPIASENAKKATKVTFENCQNAYQALENADGLIVTTEWNEFRNPNLDQILKTLKQKVIFDGRNIFDPLKMKHLGFQYYCFGRENLREAKT